MKVNKMDKVKLSSIIQKSEEKQYVLGIVYAPDEVDLQGDYASLSSIEKACHDFTILLQKPSVINKSYSEIMKSIFKCLSEKGEVKLDVTEVYQDIQKGALGLQHEDWSNGIGEIVENYIAPCDMTIGDQAITKGTWLMGVILSKSNWELVKSGDLTGLSMGGKAEKVAKGVIH